MKQTLIKLNLTSCISEWLVASSLVRHVIECYFVIQFCYYYHFTHTNSSSFYKRQKLHFFWNSSLIYKSSLHWKRFTFKRYRDIDQIIADNEQYVSGVISKLWLLLAFVDYYFDDFKYTTILNVKNINMDINIQLAVNPESLPHTKRQIQFTNWKWKLSR